MKVIEMTEDQRKLKAAIIGLGFIGAGDDISGEAIGQCVHDLTDTHAQMLAANPHVKLVTGSSRDEGRRKRFEKRMGIDKTYADWRQMLADEKLDIVCIATNSPSHADIIVACAKAGAGAIFCEKPITTRLSDADRAIAACRDSETVLVINHNRRWETIWLAARDQIRKGTIGDVYNAAGHWPTGRLGCVGTHVFDSLNMMLDSKPRAVSASLDPEIWPDCRGPQYRDPGGWGIVDYHSGVKAFINAPQTAKLPLMARVVGSLGHLTVRDSEAKIELWDGSEQTISPTKDEPSFMARALDDIVNCLVNGQEPPTSTGEDGLDALEMVIGFHVSDRRKGQWVQLPTSGDDRDLEVLIG